MTGHKVLLFEPVHQKGLDHLTENGATIVYAQGFDAESIKRAVPDVAKHDREEKRKENEAERAAAERSAANLRQPTWSFC